MPELAGKVTIDLARKKLLFDGVEFPYYLSEEGPKLGGVMASGELRSVTITFYTADLEVIPNSPLSAEEAQRRVERAQRELVEAQRVVKNATEDVMAAQRDFEAAQDEAERFVAERP